MENSGANLNQINWQDLDSISQKITNTQFKDIVRKYIIGLRDIKLVSKFDYKNFKFTKDTYDKHVKLNEEFKTFLKNLKSKEFYRGLDKEDIKNKFNLNILHEKDTDERFIFRKYFGDFERMTVEDIVKKDFENIVQFQKEIESMISKKPLTIDEFNDLSQMVMSFYSTSRQYFRIECMTEEALKLKQDLDGLKIFAWTIAGMVSLCLTVGITGCCIKFCKAGLEARYRRYEQEQIKENSFEAGLFLDFKKKYEVSDEEILKTLNRSNKKVFSKVKELESYLNDTKRPVGNNVKLKNPEHEELKQIISDIFDVSVDVNYNEKIGEENNPNYNETKMNIQKQLLNISFDKNGVRQKSRVSNFFQGSHARELMLPKLKFFLYYKDVDKEKFKEITQEVFSMDNCYAAKEKVASRPVFDNSYFISSLIELSSSYIAAQANSIASMENNQRQNVHLSEAEFDNIKNTVLIPIVDTMNAYKDILFTLDKYNADNFFITQSDKLQNNNIKLEDIYKIITGKEDSYDINLNQANMFAFCMMEKFIKEELKDAEKSNKNLRKLKKVMQNIKNLKEYEEMQTRFEEFFKLKLQNKEILVPESSDILLQNELREEEYRKKLYNNKSNQEFKILEYGTEMVSY